MALATKLLAGKSVTELVQNLHGRHRYSEIQPILRGEKCLKRRQLAPKLLVIDQHERDGGQTEHQGQHQTPSGKQPTEPRQKPIENLLWVDSSKTDRKDIR